MTYQMPGGTPPNQPPQKKRHILRAVVLSVLGIVALIVVIAVATGGGSKPGTPAAVSVTDPNGMTCTTTTVQLNGYCPGDSPATTPAATTPAAPQYTVSQQSAIQDAESYLQAEPGFSKLGLIGQLEFDKFSYADARFAVSHITVSWYAQAAADARNYMQDEGGFSYGSLVQQLEFDKFTPAQAQYGAKAAGL